LALLKKAFINQYHTASENIRFNQALMGSNKEVFAWLMLFVLAFVLCQAAPVRACGKQKHGPLRAALDKIHSVQESVNWKTLLDYSFEFYEAQQTGPIPEWSRPALANAGWRSNSYMNDGADIGKDLTGGWFDAGGRP
jgi:hypothetical protein